MGLRQKLTGFLRKKLVNLVYTSAGHGRRATG